MPRVRLFAIVFFVLTSCGQKANKMSSQVAATEDPLDVAMRWWEAKAPRCEGFPAKEHCDDGDAVIFNGLLCAAGDSRGCATVHDAQAPSGQWFRSPRRTPDNLGEGHSFSRDQTMGVLLYLIQTKDRDAAVRWMSWVEDHRPCEARTPFGNCIGRGLPRVCTDDENMTCTITQGLWSLISRVWKYLDLPLNFWMRANDNLDYELHPIEAQTSPLGYATHLNGVHNFIKRLLNVADGSRQRGVDALLARQPSNPFFKWLRDGGSEGLKAQILELCPTENSSHEHWNQWAWERETSEHAWSDSMGWDCLFLGKLIQKQ